MKNEIFWAAGGILMMALSLNAGQVDTLLIDFSQLTGQAVSLVRLAFFAAALGCVWKVVDE